MVQDEFGATSVGTDASPKFKLKAVGDASVYEFSMTREVAMGLFEQLAEALFDDTEHDSDLHPEPSVGTAVDLEGSANLSASTKI